jgi:hypothetical protein
MSSNAIKWIDPLPEEFTRTATVAVGTASDRISYRVNKSEDGTYWVIRIEEKSPGFANYHLGTFASEEEGKEAAETEFASKDRV